MLVLSLDPGRTTGFALASIPEDPVVGYGQWKLSPREFWRFLDENLNASFECHVICESFEFRQGKQLGVDLYPCELIGILKLHRTMHVDMTDQLYFQPASVQSKKGYFSDKYLKELGLYRKGFEHGRSAVKHLLHWVQFGPGSQFGTPLEDFELIDVPMVQMRELSLFHERG